MENQNLQAIFEKAKKLHTLSERAGTPEEAANAASKLQDMLLKYNLSISEVRDHVPQEYIREEVEIMENRNHKNWVSMLFHNVAKVNQCETCYHPKKSKISIVGEPHNIKMVHYIYGYLLFTIKSLAEQASKKVQKDKAQFKRAFCIGATITVAKRLREELQTSQENNAAINALVVTSNQLVRKEFRKHFPHTKTGPSPLVKNASGLAEGKEAGKGIALKRGIEGNSSTQFAKIA